MESICWEYIQVLKSSSPKRKCQNFRTNAKESTGPGPWEDSLSHYEKLRAVGFAFLKFHRYLGGKPPDLK